MKSLKFTYLSILFILSGCVSDSPTSETKSKHLDEYVLDARVSESLSHIDSSIIKNTGYIILDSHVLIVGKVKNREDHRTLLKAVWETRGVKNVMDYVLESPKSSDVFTFQQSMLKMQLDAKLLTSSLKSSHFKTIFFANNLYVLVKHASPEEREQFEIVVQRLSGIKKVFWHETKSENP